MRLTSEKINIQLIGLPITYTIFRIQEQPRLPAFSRNHAVLFLHACYWDQTAARSALEKYGSIRAAAPELFDNRDPFLPSIQQVFDLW